MTVTVTMLLQVLTTGIMKCWPTLTAWCEKHGIQSFFQSIFEDSVFSKYFSHWSHLQLQLLRFLADLDTSVLGEGVAGKWEQCSLLWKLWFMLSALYHVEFNGHLPRMAFLPSQTYLSLLSLSFLLYFIASNFSNGESMGISDLYQ